MTEEEVVQLRERRASGESVSALARAYGISRQFASGVCNGSRHKNVGGPITKGVPPRGAACHKTVLTEAQVREIRRLYQEERHLSYADIAKMFGISRGHISSIISRRVWKYL